MSFVQSFKLALKSLMSSKVRSILTMLGIIIGVAAVIVIVGLGNGMEAFMKESFKNFGTNVLEVNIFSDGSNRSVSVDYMYDLIDKNQEYFSGISPTVQINSKLRIGSEQPKQVKTIGVSEEYGDMKNYKLSEGRFIQYIDVSKRNNICVIGSNVKKEFFPNGAIDGIVKIGGIPFTVVGVLESVAKNEPGSVDDYIYIPYENALNISKINQVNNYSVVLTSEEKAPEAKKIVEDALFDVFKTDYWYYVMSMAQMIAEASVMINVMVTILASIAAISLVVGGIGIMNIMLVSVSERTREIGIRKALGAKHKHIMRQFVIEAATTSAVGGMIGIIIGYLLSAIGSQVISMIAKESIAVLPSTSSVLMAFFISVSIGMIFGYLPAKKAAKLNPIDALRHE